jgi:hypothetical protein
MVDAGHEGELPRPAPPGDDREPLAQLRPILRALHAAASTPSIAHFKALSMQSLTALIMGSWASERECTGRTDCAGRESRPSTQDLE